MCVCVHYTYILIGQNVVNGEDSFPLHSYVLTQFTAIHSEC